MSQKEKLMHHAKLTKTLVQQLVGSVGELYQNEMVMANDLDSLRKTVFVLVRYLMDTADFSVEKLEAYAEKLREIEASGEKNPIPRLLGIEVPEEQEAKDELPAPPESGDAPVGAVYF